MKIFMDVKLTRVKARYFYYQLALLNEFEINILINAFNCS